MQQKIKKALKTITLIIVIIFFVNVARINPSSAGNIFQNKKDSPLLLSQASTVDEVNTISKLTSVLVLSPNIAGLENSTPSKVQQEISTIINQGIATNIAGTGIIISREEIETNTYLYHVLTNSHVLIPDNNYFLVTSDGKSHPASSGVSTIPLASQDSQSRYVERFGQYDGRTGKTTGIDLAVVTFRSDQKYPVAVVQANNQPKVGEKIMVSGFKNPEPGKKRVNIQSSGQIQSFPQNSETRQGDFGYSLAYNVNLIGPGMSGGPVLNEKGEVIGNHGRQAFSKDNQKDGLGIPVTTLISSREFQDFLRKLGKNKSSYLTDPPFPRSLLTQTSEGAIDDKKILEQGLGIDPDSYFYEAVQQLSKKGCSIPLSSGLTISTRGEATFLLNECFFNIAYRNIAEKQITTESNNTEDINRLTEKINQLNQRLNNLTSNSTRQENSVLINKL